MRRSVLVVMTILQHNLRGCQIDICELYSIFLELCIRKKCGMYIKTIVTCVGVLWCCYIGERIHR